VVFFLSKSLSTPALLHNAFSSRTFPLSIPFIGIRTRITVSRTRRLEVKKVVLIGSFEFGWCHVTRLPRLRLGQRVSVYDAQSMDLRYGHVFAFFPRAQEYDVDGDDLRRSRVSATMVRAAVSLA